MLAGFRDVGYACTHAPSVAANPVAVEWHVNGESRRFRLWCFEVTHGGGQRSAEEFRIQVTSGPARMADFGAGGAVDLLVGYSRDRDVVVAYDRRWLERWVQRSETEGTGGSPSVQVQKADIEAGRETRIHRLTKNAAFGAAGVVTMHPVGLPAYLFNHEGVLGGAMSAEGALEAIPQPDDGTIVEYCRERGFHFEPDLIARYLAALLAKPFVILAGVSGTGKSKLAELVAEYYGRTEQGGADPEGQPEEAGGFVFVRAKGPPDPTRFALVAVRPDWNDHQSMLGFVNPITGRYESTQALDLVLRADRALGKAEDKASAPRHFMLLDEMNLARVEHYFSDWLACAESRRPGPNGAVEQQSVPLHRSNEPMWITWRSRTAPPSPWRFPHRWRCRPTSW